MPVKVQRVLYIHQFEGFYWVAGNLSSFSSFELARTGLNKLENEILAIPDNLRSLSTALIDIIGEFKEIRFLECVGIKNRRPNGNAIWQDYDRTSDDCLRTGRYLLFLGLRRDMELFRHTGRGKANTGQFS